MSPTDEQLMIAVGKGNMDAFEQIVVRYQKLAWRTAYRYTGNYSDAEEIAQEAFLRILDSAQNYRPSAKFNTYLYEILTNLCLGHYRKKSPQPTDEHTADKRYTEAPSSNLQIQERDQAMKQAVDSLPARQRLVVILRHYENLSYEKIAPAIYTSVKGNRTITGPRKAEIGIPARRFFHKIIFFAWDSHHLVRLISLEA